MEGSIPFHRQHGVELGGPGVALGLVEMELREDIVSGTNLSFSTSKIRCFFLDSS